MRPEITALSELINFLWNKQLTPRMEPVCKKLGTLVVEDHRKRLPNEPPSTCSICELGIIQIENIFFSIVTTLRLSYIDEINGKKFPSKFPMAPSPDRLLILLNAYPELINLFEIVENDYLLLRPEVPFELRHELGEYAYKNAPEVTMDEGLIMPPKI